MVVVADAALTGMLHYDGLADSADGLLPHLERTRRLDVMGAPDTGAFAVVVIGLTMLARVAAIGSMRFDGQQLAVLVILWSMARTGMAITLRHVPYARGQGLVSAFSGGGGAIPGGVVVVVIALVAAGPSVRLAAVMAAGVLAFVAVIALAWRRIGGYTGDVLGAAGVISETVGLVVASARW
jgi:adenosylcobinamide-GDP ribazoletransferase